MFCVQCGNQLEEDARFCSVCGTPVAEMLDETEALPANRAPFGSQMNPAQEQARTKLSTPMIAAIAVAAIVIIALIALFVVGQGNRDAQPEAQQASQAAESQSASSADAGTSADQAQAESESKPADEADEAEPVEPQIVRAQARDAAIAQGKQVFTGSIVVTTREQSWIMSEGRDPNPGSSYSLETVTVLFLDQKTSIEGADPARLGTYKTLQDQDIIELPESFSSYDGQRVDMAFTLNDLSMPSDVSHIKGTGEVIFVEGEDGTGSTSTAASASSASADDEDYILPDSATKCYTRQELETLDDRTLFIARNEIYARHGRKFASAELQRHFGSKSWYHGTIDPNSFTESMLSDTELANVRLILEIEQSRNSKYLQ